MKHTNKEGVNSFPRTENKRQMFQEGRVDLCQRSKGWGFAKAGPRAGATDHALQWDGLVMPRGKRSPKAQGLVGLTSHSRFLSTWLRSVSSLPWTGGPEPLYLDCRHGGGGRNRQGSVALVLQMCHLSPALSPFARPQSTRRGCIAPLSEVPQHRAPKGPLETSSTLRGMWAHPRSSEKPYKVFHFLFLY